MIKTKRTRKRRKDEKIKHHKKASLWLKVSFKKWFKRVHWICRPYLLRQVIHSEFFFKKKTNKKTTTSDLSTSKLFQSTCHSHINFCVHLIKRKISCSPLAKGSSGESNAVHSSGPHFVLRELSLLKPTVMSRFTHPRARSNYATPANQLSVTASGPGNNTTFVRSPRVPSPQRTLMKTDRKWGWKAWAGNDHI